MVRKERRDDKSAYVCERCGFAYKERMWAERCEDYCTKNNACSLEIISHALVDR